MNDYFSGSGIDENAGFPDKSIEKNQLNCNHLRCPIQLIWNEIGLHRNFKKLCFRRDQEIKEFNTLKTGYVFIISNIHYIPGR